MALNSATIAGLTASANELAAALALRTNFENLRKNAIQANFDAAVATKLLDSCLEAAGANNKAAVDTILTTLG
jgi:hypothetical protein